MLHYDAALGPHPGAGEMRMFFTVMRLGPKETDETNTFAGKMGIGKWKLGQRDVKTPAVTRIYVAVRWAQPGLPCVLAKCAAKLVLDEDHKTTIRIQLLEITNAVVEANSNLLWQFI